MKLRFYNAKILTMENENIINGELCTDGGRISYVGEERQNGDFDREIDLAGNLIIPGFKNAHTHTAMTFLRSFADDLPLNDWLYNQVFRTRQSSPRKQFTFSPSSALWSTSQAA